MEANGTLVGNTHAGRQVDLLLKQSPFGLFLEARPLADEALLVSFADGL
jgi:hypothetical protein